MPRSALAGSGYSFDSSGGSVITGGGTVATVRASTQADIAALAGGAPSVVDGVALNALDIVLVSRQLNQTQNGIYRVDVVGAGANGTWTRAPAYDTGPELDALGLVYVREGVIDADRVYGNATDPPIALGVTNIVFNPLLEESVYVGIAGENLTTADVVRFDRSGGGTAGRVLRAQANATDFDIIGVVVSSALTGNTVQVYTAGSIPVTFSGGAPPATSNGVRVYLDPVAPGRGTTTLPVAPGQAVVKVGQLTGANGVTTTPRVLLSMDVVATLLP